MTIAVSRQARRIGYTKDEMTGQGFRSIASTLLHEQGWNHQAIEGQLAHAERNAKRGAKTLPSISQFFAVDSEKVEGKDPLVIKFTGERIT